MWQTSTETPPAAATILFFLWILAFMNLASYTSSTGTHFYCDKWLRSQANGIISGGTVTGICVKSDGLLHGSGTDLLHKNSPQKKKKKDKALKRSSSRWWRLKLAPCRHAELLNCCCHSPPYCPAAYSKGQQCFDLPVPHQSLELVQTVLTKKQWTWSIGTFLTQAGFEPVNQQKYAVRRQLILFAILF